MPLNVGDRVGHYAITELLGEGGMGRVYRATDSKLRRDVALKILPETCVHDRDRLARFEREAQVVAALNHPNIAAIFGVEDIVTDGRREPALVLELVEGPTLADRIVGGRLSPEEALPIARQIAEALEAAHDAGVVHRDLKPANIKLRPDGTVKVLDFGLARTLGGDSAETPNASQSPTIISPAMTRTGVILGTAAYMSPEQARGDVADRRADVWAFGCVLFEMLTGGRAFEGETVSDTLAAVLRAEPEWHRLPSGLHPRLRLMLERCLEKNVRNRYQGIGDARVDVQQVLDHPGSDARQGVTPRSTRSRELTAGIAAAAVVVSIITALVLWTRGPAQTRVAARLTHVLPLDQTWGGTARPIFAVAPDGSAFVYVVDGQLFLRPMNELVARPIRGGGGQVSTPFFSPDSRSVGYWDSGDEGLKVIDVGGGTPVVLTRATIVRGASWAADGTILYATNDGIWSVRNDGQKPQRIVPLERGWMHGPHLLPNQRSVLYTRLPEQRGYSWEGAEIVVRNLDTGEDIVVVAGEDARYVPTGHLVFAVGTTLFAAPFDPVAARLTGARVPIVEGVRREVWVAGNTAAANYDFSHDGVLAYIHGPAERAPVIPRDLMMVDLNGNSRPITDVRRDYWRPRVSPDGSRVAVEVFDGKARHIWMVDLDNGHASQLTFGVNQFGFPVWSTDGLSVVFTRGLGGEGIYQKPVDGSSEATLLFGAEQLVPTDTHDGTLVFSRGDQTSERAIWTMSLPTKDVTEILATQAQEHHAMVSPDGLWLAYASNASGVQEVYVRPYPIVEGTERRVSEGGGAGPVWSPDGSALYYRSQRDRLLMVASIGPGGRPGRSRSLFAAERFRFSGNAPAFDIHPDGKRFVMVTQGDEPPPEPAQINVVLDWFEELRQRVPTGR
jgi:serine/threonine-protein kinase